MAPLWLGKSKREGGAPTADGKERRRGVDRRAVGERRGSRRRDGAGRGSTRDLYQSDLDRHLWSWASPTKKKRRRAKAKRERRRKMAGMVAAGLSYFLYRRLREEEEPEDPEEGQADLDEADFE